MMFRRNSESLNRIEAGSGAALIVAGIFLIGFGAVYAWLIGFIGAIALFWTSPKFKKSIGLLYLSLGLVAVAPINTDISTAHIFYISAFLLPAAILPYAISRHVFKSDLIRLPLFLGRQYIREIALFFTLTLIPAYFILPFYLNNTGVYQNWSVLSDATSLIVLFLTIMSLGVWDEIFFSGIVLGTLKNFFSYTLSNLAQAALFTSFLFALGFRGWWGPLLIFGFGVVRGEVFRRTKSLAPLLVIHATIDVVLYFALVNMTYPELFLRFFI